MLKSVLLHAWEDEESELSVSLNFLARLDGLVASTGGEYSRFGKVDREDGSVFVPCDLRGRITKVRDEHAGIIEQFSCLQSLDLHFKAKMSCQSTPAGLPHEHFQCG